MYRLYSHKCTSGVQFWGLPLSLSYIKCFLKIKPAIILAFTVILRTWSGVGSTLISLFYSNRSSCLGGFTSHNLQGKLIRSIERCRKRVRCKVKTVSSVAFLSVEWNDISRIDICSTTKLNSKVHIIACSK